MGKTIKEIAQNLNVSKQAVWQRIKRNKTLQKAFNEHSKTFNGTVFIDEIGEDIIKSAYSNATNTINIDETKTNVDINIDNNKVFTTTIDSNKLIETLEKTLDSLKEQLNVKDKQINELTSILKSSQIQIENLTNALKTAQALHAGTIKERLTSESESEQADITEDKTEKEIEEKQKGFFSRLFKKRI